jgi:chromosome segregation ATPase
MSVKQITVGQDSFLDIVANLVGVLIILVVVIGAQATSAWQPETDLQTNSQSESESVTASVASLDAEIDAAKASLQTADGRVRKMEVDNRLLEDQIVQQSSVMIDLASQRHQMLVQTQIVQQQLEQRREQRQQQQQRLTEKQQEQLEQQHRERQLETELAAIKSEAAAVAAAAAPPKSEVIDHFPNPIAKTVFSEEVHFQLRGGKLSYVPLEELVSKMKSEWKIKSEKLKTAYRTIETVGPIGNFRLQYELDSEIVSQMTQYGAVERQAVRFDGFTILPIWLIFGDTISYAFI